MRKDRRGAPVAIFFCTDFVGVIGVWVITGASRFCRKSEPVAILLSAKTAFNRFGLKFTNS